MKFKNLIKKLGVPLIVIMLSTVTFGQTKDKNFGIWLNGGTGYCFADTYDNGAAPMSFMGFGLSFQMGATVEWRRCHIQEETRVLPCILILPTEGYEIGLQKKWEFLYRIKDGKRNRLHLWAGGGLSTDFIFKMIPALNNASTGSESFQNLCAAGMVLYDFAFVKNDTHNLLTAYGKMTLPLMGFAQLPSFSYMDNYTSNIILSNTILSSYENKAIAFPGVSTDVGIRFNLLNGNKIGFSYRWDFMSSRNLGTYRFDNAFHSFIIDLMFKLN